MTSSTATLALDQWQILFQKTMEALQCAQEAVKQQFGFLGIVKGFWRVASDLKGINASLKAISELPDGMLGDEFIQAQIPRLHKLLKSINELLEVSKHKGLTNQTVTGASLGLISIRGEYIADYLEALEMSIDPEVLKAIEEGHAQIQRGEFEVMERLF
jgi:hypothetical protein